MTLDRKAFLATIKEQPDGDGPRLVYADWLEEQGNPRAEFIRVQCALARYRPLDEVPSHLTERDLWLVNRYGNDWRKEDLGPADKFLDSVNPVFHRGFIAGVEVDLEVIAHRGVPNALLVEPLLRHIAHPRVLVRNVDRMHALHTFLEVEWMQRVHTLILDNNPVGVLGVRSLASSPLPSLRALHLNVARITDAAVRELMRSPLFSNLSSLELSGNMLTKACVANLRRSARSKGISIYTNGQGGDFAAWRYGETFLVRRRECGRMKRGRRGRPGKTRDVWQ
ncbi:MAG: leucine-rich repeat-containing protein typical subtype [Parcubacteria group bacterium Gr01-1014_106]|nr:MAG: leucine-rich repeat-containing protein typical subtype [Parcubacteria group bacterium Gr01-1014_106]